MAIAVMAAAAAPARAQDDAESEEDELIAELDLKTLLNTPVDVWTPSKAAQKRHEAPSIVSIVTREQISVWGFRSMAELLSHLLGFYVVDDHSLPNVAVRGISGGLHSDSSLIKVLINGHPVSFAPTGGNWLGPELVPLSAIDRVEIIRGPASALYGADAFLGMINIQTRSRDGVSGATAWLTIGRIGEHRASDVDVSLGTKRGMVEALVAFRQNDQDLSGLELPESSPAPRIPIYNRGARTAAGLEQSSSTAIATLTLRPNQGRSLGAFAYYSSMERGAEFGSLLQLAHGYNERNAFSENRVSQWQLRAGLALGEEITPRLKLSLRGAYFRGGTRDANRLEVGSEFYFVRRRLRSSGGDFDAHLEWTPSDALVIAGGAGLVLDRERLPARIAVAKRPIGGVERGEVIADFSVYQDRKSFLNLGAYLQGTFRAFEGRVGLTGGLRADRHNVYGGQLSRRIGLVGSPTPTLHAKLLHGSAFQAPSPFVLYAVPAASGDVIGNPGLRPQFVNTFEFQIEWEPAGPLKLSTDVAYSLLADKAEVVQRGINLVARNVVGTSTLSWESKGELTFRQWLNGYLSFELQRTVLRTGQEGHPGRLIGTEGGVYPRLMIHGGLAAQLGGWPLRAAVMSSYIGARRSSGTNSLFAGRPYTLPAYLLLEATLATEGFRVLRSPDQEISLGLSGKNLLDVKGPMPGFSGVDYPVLPRAFFLQMNVGM